MPALSGDDRVLLVGSLWSLLLLVLLVLLEVLRAGSWPAGKRIVPVVSKLVVVMIIAFSIAAVLRVADLTSPTHPAATPPVTGVVPTPEPSVLPTRAAFTPSPPSPSPTSVQTATPAPSAPAASPTPRTTGSPGPTPEATPSPPPQPTPTPKPTPSVEPTPTPTPTPEPTPPQAGRVSVPSTFLAYDVAGDMVTGFHRVHASSRFAARADAPQSFRYPTFSHPNASIQLLQIISGPYAGTWIGLSDPGVQFVPGG